MFPQALLLILQKTLQVRKKNNIVRIIVQSMTVYSVFARVVMCVFFGACMGVSFCALATHAPASDAFASSVFAPSVFTGSFVSSASQSHVLSPPLWTQKERGLDMAKLPLIRDNAADKPRGHITALRFDPQYFDFEVYTISERTGAAQTLVQWAKQYDLVAAINASMYLPDGTTSTGYLRKEGHVNNKRIAERFGAFFLSCPKNPTESSAHALLIDRETENWQQTLAAYNTVVQNYRLISSTGNILWSAGGRTHSIAAVGSDTKGRILFLHCVPPISAHDFARTLLHHPIDIVTVMYVEGGVQAGLVLRLDAGLTFWGGSHPAEIFTGSVSVALPNIIGVKRKQATP